jgi:hypothetical protein
MSDSYSSETDLGLSLSNPNLEAREEEKDLCNSILSWKTSERDSSLSRQKLRFSQATREKLKL